MSASLLLILEDIDDDEISTLFSLIDVDVFPLQPPIANREIKEIKTDDSLLVGCFDYMGKSAFYLVNNSLTELNNEITMIVIS